MVGIIRAAEMYIKKQKIFEFLFFWQRENKKEEIRTNHDNRYENLPDSISFNH